MKAFIFCSAIFVSLVAITSAGETPALKDFTCNSVYGGGVAMVHGEDNRWYALATRTFNEKEKADPWVIAICVTDHAGMDSATHGGIINIVRFIDGPEVLLAPGIVATCIQGSVRYHPADRLFPMRKSQFKPQMLDDVLKEKDEKQERRVEER